MHPTIILSIGIAGASLNICGKTYTEGETISLNDPNYDTLFYAGLTKTLSDTVDDSDCDEITGAHSSETVRNFDITLKFEKEDKPFSVGYVGNYHVSVNPTNDKPISSGSMAIGVGGFGGFNRSSKPIEDEIPSVPFTSGMVRDREDDKEVPIEAIQEGKMYMETAEGCPFIN